MARKSIEFDRTTLYEQIWARPMMHVAADYGLSDVALRKICLKLKIPLPETGHWAKAAAGSVPEKQPLLPSDGPTVHTYTPTNRTIDEEVLERIPAVLEQFPETAHQIPETLLNLRLEECAPIVRRMFSRAKKAPKDQREWPALYRSDVLGLSVSAKMQTHTSDPGRTDSLRVRRWI